MSHALRRMGCELRMLLSRLPNHGTRHRSKRAQQLCGRERASLNQACSRLRPTEVRGMMRRPRFDRYAGFTATRCGRRLTIRYGDIAQRGLRIFHDGLAVSVGVNF
jgi:hypothetical protein